MKNQRSTILDKPKEVTCIPNIGPAVPLHCLREIETLTENLSMSGKHIEHLKAKNEQLIKELNNDSVLNANKIALNDAQVSLEKTKALLLTASERIFQLNFENDQLSEKINEVKKRVNPSNDTINGLKLENDRLNTLIRERGKQHEDFKILRVEENRRLEIQMDEFKAKNTTLKNRLEKKQDECESLFSENEELTDDKTELEVNYKKLIGVKKELTETISHQETELKLNHSAWMDFRGQLNIIKRKINNMTAIAIFFVTMWGLVLLSHVDNISEFFTELIK